MDKKRPTETDIRTKFITPARVGTRSANWNVMTQSREEVFFTKGRVIVRGKTVRRAAALVLRVAGLDAAAGCAGPQATRSASAVTAAVDTANGVTKVFENA